MREFDIIRKHFARLPQGGGVALGIGDDAAVLKFPAAQHAVATLDTMSEGVHFFKNENPFYLARKAAAISLSDIAAMGARPAWLLLSLCLPGKVGEEWLKRFAAGLRSSAREFSFGVVGGDTTRGRALTISTALIGSAKNPLRRKGAKAGDDLWVSGDLGGAAMGVAILKKKKKAASESAKKRALSKLRNPPPRVALGLRLSSVARAAMDLSDGLLFGAEELARQSRLAVRVCRRAVPLSLALRGLAEDDAFNLAANGGDDYELLFAAPRTARRKVQNIAAALRLPLHRVGEFAAGRGVFLVQTSGAVLPVKPRGYEHHFGG